METQLKAKLDFIFGRRSIRVFTHEVVSEGAVHILLQAAMSAPSAAAKDPWRFVVIRDPMVLQAIAEALPNGKMISTASVGLIVCGDLEAAHDRQLSYLLQDCSAAIQNLLLAAHVLGLGACWLGIHPREDRIERLRQTLGLPAKVIPIGGVAVGYPGETKELRTRFNEQYVHQDRW